MGISVLMSVYAKDDPEYVRKAVSSIADQTFPAEEIVIVKDGPLTEGLEQALAGLPGELRVPVRFVPLPKNSGLGIALRKGLEACTQEIIARMDADDIARPDRLEKEYTWLEEHPDVSAVGGNIAEFEKEGEILRYKEMPVTYREVYAYGKLRNPLNHMTVMFRKEDVLRAGSYRHFPSLEDYDLWTRMLAAGMKIENLPEVLVDVRLGTNFADRRGGREYFARYRKLRRMQRDLGYTSAAEYLAGLSLTFVMTRMPSGLRGMAYRRLRKQ